MSSAIKLSLALLTLVGSFFLLTYSAPQVLIGIFGIFMVLLLIAFLLASLWAIVQIRQETDDLIRQLVKGIAEAETKIGSAPPEKQEPVKRLLSQAQNWLDQALEYKADHLNRPPADVQAAARSGLDMLELANNLLTEGPASIDNPATGTVPSGPSVAGRHR